MKLPRGSSTAKCARLRSGRGLGPISFDFNTRKSGCQWIQCTYVVVVLPGPTSEVVGSANSTIQQLVVLGVIAVLYKLVSIVASDITVYKDKHSNLDKFVGGFAEDDSSNLVEPLEPGLARVIRHSHRNHIPAGAN